MQVYWIACAAAMAGNRARWHSSLLWLVLATHAAADGVYPFSDGIATYQVVPGKPILQFNELLSNCTCILRKYWGRCPSKP